MSGEKVAQRFNLDHINDGDAGLFDDFQTFSTNSEFTNLASVLVSGFGALDRNSYSVDNIQLSAVTVPEPTALTIFVIAILLIASRKVFK